jgi:SnoaL-like protein
MYADTVTVPPSTHPFRDAFVAGDLDAMRDTMTPDVVLNSPILTTPFEGREAVLELFSVILQTLEDVRYTMDVADGDMRFLSWHTRIGKVEMQGADILRLDEDGRIEEFTVFFRPLVGITALASALGKGLAGRRSRTRGLVAAAASAPMVLLSRAGDRIAPRLVQ